EARVRAAPVLASRGGCDCREADVVPASPVPRDRTEGGKARMPAVRVDADAVDPGAADDRDAPAPLRTRAEHCEGVVPDMHVAGPASCGDCLLERMFLGGEVDAGDQQLGEVGDRTVVVARQARLAE